MKMKWLATTAIAFMFGTGAVVAQQSDHAQKQDERATSRAQTHEQKAQPDRHAAGDEMKGRTTGKAEEKAGEPRSGEAASNAEHHQQTQQRQEHGNTEPTRQSEEQQRRGERPGPNTAQQEHKGHGSTTGQASEEHRAREGQKSERAQDTKGSGNNTGQTTGQARAPEGQKGEHAQDEKRSGNTTQQSQQKNDRSEQTSQRSQPSTQQSERERGTQAGQQRQGENTGQATDRTSRHTEINDDQRQKIVKQLRSESTANNQNVNVHVNVGERLPQRIDVHQLPPDIVSIAPQYRGYDYTVIDNRIAIVNPRSREVVHYIDEGPDQGSTASYGSDHVVVSADVRDRFRELARRSSSSTVGSTASSSGGGSTCLSLRPVPEDLVRDHPDLSKYRYLTIGDEAVLVDPQQHKIVQVID